MAEGMRMRIKKKRIMKVVECMFCHEPIILEGLPKEIAKRKEAFCGKCGYRTHIEEDKKCRTTTGA
jgi:transcription elongation factor Elf1